MKKIICATLALLMMLSMAACAGSNSNDETVKPTTPSTNATDATGKPGDSTSKPTDATDATTTPTEGTGKFEENVLVNNDKITFTVTGVKQDPIWGYTLQVFVENKTDKNLMFSMDDVSVNGFMVDPLWAESIAPGKKSNGEIRFSEKSFKDNGIETVEELEFTLRVYNEKDWSEEDTHKEKFNLKMQ